MTDGAPKFDRTGNLDVSTRLLLVNSTLHIGGAERIGELLACKLDSRRFQVTACYLKECGSVGDSMLRAGVDLVPVPGHAPGTTDRLTALKLRRLIRERSIDVVHTHDVHGLIDATVCRRLMPNLRHVHTFHFGNYPHRDPFSQRAERLCWRSPDALVAVGHEQAAAIQDLYGISNGRMRVIWNGVEEPVPVPACEFRARLEAAPRPVILSISTLIEQKGIDHLLRAARILQDRGVKFRLVVVGHGHLRAPLERHSAELGLGECVEFLGWVPDAARRVLPFCDVFVQSSLWEAMSVVVLEAMAAARPMAVTRVGENAQVVSDEESGLLVPPADPRALADSLARLIADEGLRARLGAAARARYLKRFTTQSMIEAYEALYLGLAEARRMQNA